MAASSTCTPPLAPGSLKWCDGMINAPGVKRKVYFTPKRDIVSWPTLPEQTGADAKKLAVYTGNFTLAADAKWKYIEVNQKKSSPTSESQGEAPFKTFLDKATFVHNGTGEDAAAFARQANNDDYVYIFETVDGKYRVLGNDIYDTDTKVSTNLGQVGGTDKGTTIEVSCTSHCPLPFYTGEIMTEDGTINPVPAPAG